MARYLVVVIRDSDPVALGRDFLASRCNNLQKKRLERFVGTEFAVLGFIPAWVALAYSLLFARMENLFRAARLRQFIKCRRREVDKLEVGGVATPLYRVGMSREIGAPRGRGHGLFWHWN